MTTGVCKVKDCLTPVLAKGMCRKHYDQKRNEERKSLIDLLDRASIALEIAGPCGLNVKVLREELSCKMDTARAVSEQLVEQGYACKEKGSYVFLRPFPSSE